MAMAWDKMSDLEYYYTAEYSGEVDGMNENEGEWLPCYHTNAYDHMATPVITSRDPGKIQLFHWGLIPHRTSSLQDALSIRQSTVMCRSEDMYDKYAYGELAKAGKRCLIPVSGYFEYFWVDAKGKTKIPYYIFLKDRPFFSIGGLYSRWTDKTSGKDFFTYTVCTTAANEFAAKIHNQGQRMPVILQTQEAERAWLNPTITKDDVVDLCRAIPDEFMAAHTVSRVITSKDNNVPEAIQPFSYTASSSPSLFE
ncbi:SOS response-associated peptidase [Pseudochryseolinea flava]|nr:SOS response-associated peptidase [Pseudochryseolinea flava]